MESNTLLPGTLLQGKSYTYTIQKVLGQGTFGITYLATTKVKVAGALGALETTMQVAIKEFFMRDINGRTENTVTTGSQGGLYANYKKKFAHEAENLSKLDHPNIVKVLEYFGANNTIYYAMEYVEGGNLDTYITQKDGLPEAECVKYAKQIGTALSYMHAHKMLHLDLKPGNIMLRKNGDAVLIDFGLSKQYDENGNPETSTTVGGGTPGYAPIEQANYHEGKGFPVTMDVYALGATMYKMLTGVRPPEAVEILNEGFPAYQLQEHQISDALIACVGKAMSALRKDRPQNIDAFLELLGGKDATDKKRIRLHNSIDNILFSFTDSPIPGYRSFIAKFTRASATVQTFIENELITKETIAYSPAQFEALISAINALKLYKVSSNLRRQSMGGETIRLGVENKLDVYHYGTKGNQEGTLIGDVYPLLELIQKEIPGFSDLWVKKQDSPHVSESKPTGGFWQKYQKVIIGGLIGGLIAAVFVMTYNTNIGSPVPTDSSAMDTITVEFPDLLENENDIMQSAASEEISTDSIAEFPPKSSTENLQSGHYTVNGYTAVDLGLSVDWATCNVGAENPWESGDYFAWGETEPKSSYWSKTYKYCSGTTESCMEIGRKWELYNNGVLFPDISESEYDAAYTIWGSGWRMPTIREAFELQSQCKWEWTELNGMKGSKVTGPNGNSIFLPAAGAMKGSKNEGLGKQGNYWTSTGEPDNKYGYARYLGISARSREYDSQFQSNYRFQGYMIRPVTEISNRTKVK